MRRRVEPHGPKARAGGLWLLVSHCRTGKQAARGTFARR
jgi:hypothetical protein